MEQRVKNLEDLCELITKELVEQNKNMIEMNKNLINEIRCLREVYAKQDEDFEEFKNLLRKIYDINRQSLNNMNMPPVYPPNLPPPPPAHMNQPPPVPGAANLPPNYPINNSFMAEHSMYNNLSFQSVQTPLHQNQVASNFSNLNITGSNYSIPSSASAMNPNLIKQIQSTMPSQSSSYQDLAQTQANKPTPSVFNPNQPPPTAMFPIQTKPQTITQQQQPAQPQVQPQQPQQQQQATLPFKFQPSQNTTSTPQTTQIPFKTQAQPPVVQQIEKPKPPQFDLSPAKPALVETTKPIQTSANNNLFAGANLFKTVEPAKPATGVFSFGNIQPRTNLFKAPPATTLGGLLGAKPQAQEEEEGEQHAGNPEEYEPQVDFKPIVQLKEVEVKTGEEDEDVLFKQRCKLYRFDSETKEWKEKGVGDLKLLKHKQTNVIRVLMRRDQVLKLCANHRVSGEMKLSEISPKQFSWMAIDFSEAESRSELLLAKFRTPEEAGEFKKEFEKAVQAMKLLDKSPTKQPTSKAPVVIASDKPSLSQQFKTDQWKCNACYAPNKKEDLKCACCATPKPGAVVPAAEPAKPIQFGTTATKPFSFGLNPTTNNTTPQQQTTTPKFDFSAKENILKNSTEQPVARTSTFIPFGTQPASINTATKPKETTTTTPTTNLFEKGSSLPSFASLAAKTSGTIFGNTAQPVSASPIFKPAGFGGGIQPSTEPIKPLFGAVSTTSAKQENEEEETGDNQNPEEYEPQVDFKPLVKLAEVDVKTGEENEEALFKQRCKLYRYDSNTKEWKEKGTGEIKVLKHKTNENVFRILMRRDQVLKLCANHRITSDLKLEIFNEKQVRWYAQDYSEGEGKHELLAARFKSEEDAKKFKQSVDDALKLVASDTSEKPVVKKEETKIDSCQGLKPSLAEMFKKENTWNCKDCYVTNKDEVFKCAACGSVRKDASGNPMVKPETQSTNVAPAKFSFGLSSTQDNKNQTPISFGQPTTNTGSLFKPLAPGESVFGNKSGLSFADLASNTPKSGFGGGFINQNVQGLFSTGAKPAMVFGAQQQTTDAGEEEAGDNQNPEEYEPQVDFKPLVKLAEVDVKTGEEDEEVLFKQRCKLYRFHTETKEWKEKGVGEIKILKHKQKENVCRILMRRDQVLKLCANHRITPEIKMEVVNEKQLRWMANDCSEGELRTELLAVRFRHDEDAKQFREEFEKAQQLSKSNPAQVQSVNNNTNNTKPQENGLKSLVKTESGSWTCSGCLASNKPNAVKCACCETAKPSESGKSEDGEIQMVFTAKPTEEQIQKARALQLPDTFYLYLNKPNCKGCPGCENEE